MVHRKVKAGAVSGAIIAVLTLVLSQFTDVAVSSEVASAITVLVGFVVSFWTPSA